MNNNLRKYDETRSVYIPPDIDTWYQLKFDRDSGYLVIIHYDRAEPLVKDGKENYREMRRIVQRASLYSRNDIPSAIYQILDTMLNNYKDLREIKQFKDYKYERKYKQSKNEHYDLAKFSNRLKRTKMPEDFIKYFFHFEDGELIVRPVVTQADIDSNSLSIDEMEKYVWSLNELEQIANIKIKKEAGWYPNGKPPIIKRYKKRQK